MIPIFKSQKYSEIFLFLLGNEKTYASKMNIKINCTYSYANKCLNLMNEQGFITSHQDGRMKYIKLTKKGRKVAEKIFELKELTK